MHLIPFQSLAHVLAQESEARELLDGVRLGDTFRNTSASAWIVLLAAIAAGVVVGKLVHSLLRSSAERMIARGWKIRGVMLLDAAGPAHLLLIVLGITIGVAPVYMDPQVQTFSRHVIAFLYIVTIGWFLFNLVDVVEFAARRFTSRTKSPLDDQLVPLLRKTLRLFLVVMFTLFIADNVFGADITAWLAGLGIAGLAVSLAAQDSIKNLFGSITIFLDRPFVVGDRIIFDGHDGPVEEIGFRSTKIRTTGGELVTIPNSKIVDGSVKNVSRRPNIQRIMDITIASDTPAAKIEQAVAIVKEILADPQIAAAWDMEKFPPRVAFNELNADSYNIRAYYWHHPPDWWKYLDHAQKLNLMIVRRFVESEVEIAFPTQMIYLTGDARRKLRVNMQQEERGDA